MEGAAFLYLGSAEGLATAPAWSGEGNEALANFGAWVASAGDVDGDGLGGVIIGAWSIDDGVTDQGAAFVYHGRPR